MVSNLLEKRWVRIVAYLVFIALTLLACLAITFPDERIKQIVIVQAERQLNAGQNRSKRDARVWEVQISDMDLWWFSGVELHDVVLKEKWSEARLERALDEAEQGAPAQKPMNVTIPRVAVRGSLLSSIVNLGGAVVFEVDFNSGGQEGGVVSGTVIQRSDGVFIDAELDGLDMYRAALIESVTGVPGFGTMDGTVSLILDPKSGLPVDGTIALTGEKLSVGPAEVKTDKLPSMAYLEVPRTSLGKLTLDAHIERRGKTPALVFDTFDANGLDVKMQAWGDVELNKVTSRSRANVSLRLQFDGEFVKKNSLGPILNIQTLRSGRNGEGWYGLTFKGSLNRMKPRGDLNAAAGPPANAQTGAAKQTGDAKKGAVKPPANAPAAKERDKPGRDSTIKNRRKK